MRSNRQYDFSHDFFCCKCGNKGIQIARKNGRNRAGGHLKKLYCIYCAREINFCECTNTYTHEDFLVEFLNGNFDENQNRIEDSKKFLRRFL